MGRMGDRVTLSRGERRWMRGEGRGGWMAKRREREKNFVRRKQASFEGERERERRAPLFGLLENAGWQNANYLALFPACKDACKKRATPLSFHIHTFPPLSSITPLYFLLTEMRFDPVSTSSIFLSLCFVHFFVFFFFFLGVGTVE